MPTNNAINLESAGIVKYDGAGSFAADTTINHCPLIGAASNGITSLGPLTSGQLVIGSTGADPAAASLTPGAGISITPGAGSITIANTGVLSFASVAETKAGTLTTKAVNPADVSGYINDFNFTGFVSWAAGGPFFDASTLGTFTVLVGGTGYIAGKLISFSGPQSVTGLTAGNTYYIYIDSTGTLQKTPTWSEALYENNIVLFECLRDSTPVTNVQYTVKENHQNNFPSATSVYLHEVVGTVISNFNNGANITLNGTQSIQINGADMLDDHGLETTIPDSGGSPVTWNKMYTTAGGKWATQNSTNTFTGFYNNAGTPTALTAGRFGVYTLYVSKDTINTSTPTYFAVLDTSQYTNSTQANNAISNGTTAKISNELLQLEFAQLGYIIYSQASNSIVQVTISKSTLRQTLSTSGTNTASLVNTNVSNFNGWLSAANTNVQSSLDTLDDVLKGGTAGQLVVSSGGVLMPVYTTATYPTTTAQGDLLLSSTANAIVTLAKDTNSSRYLSNTGANNNAVWDQVSLTTGVSGVLPIANGGTNANSMATSTGIVKYDGTSLVTSSTAKIDSSNRYTNTSQPAFTIYRDSTINDVTGDGTVYTVVFNQTKFDQNSNITGGTTFTAPVAGKYFFTCNVYLSGMLSGHTGAVIKILRGSTIIGFIAYNPFAAIADGSGACSINCSCFTALAVSDTVTVTAAVSGGTKVIDIANNGEGTNFSGFLVC